MPQRAHFHRAEIERAAGERIDVRLGAVGFRRVLLVPSPPSQQSVDAREEDRELEGLGQVVVRTSLESSQHVFRAAARGEHQDRQELLGRTQLRRDGEAVFARQHHVEDHDVEDAPLFQQEIERLLAVCRDDRLMAFGLEIELEAVGDVLLVFDDQDSTHVVSRGSSSVNVAPRPSPSLCANTRPPCARAIDRTM